MSPKDIKYALFQHVRGPLFISCSQPALLQSDQHCSLESLSYGLENKALWNKQAAGRLWHFSLSHWRAQVMYSCLRNEGYLFVQKAGYGRRWWLNILSCQITCDDWKHSPYCREDNELIFNKYLVTNTTHHHFVPMIHSSNTWESSLGKDTEMMNSFPSRSSGLAWVSVQFSRYMHMNMWNGVRIQRAEWTILGLKKGVTWQEAPELSKTRKWARTRRWWLSRPGTEAGRVATRTPTGGSASDSRQLNSGVRRGVSGGRRKKQTEAILGGSLAWHGELSASGPMRENLSLLRTTWDNSLSWNWNNLCFLCLPNIFTIRFRYFKQKKLFFRKREFNTGHCLHKWQES